MSMLHFCKDFLVLIVRLREGMHAALVEGVEVIIRIRRIQRGADGIDAGVRDRPGGQARVRIGVIRADERLVRVGKDLLALRQCILDGRVDLEARIELAAKTVIDDGSDVRAFRGLCRLLLDQRRNDDDIVQIKRRIADLLLREAVFLHLCGELSLTPLTASRSSCVSLRSKLRRNLPMTFSGSSPR